MLPSHAQRLMPDAPAQGFEASVERHRISPEVHDAVSEQYKPLFFHGGVPLAYPAPTKSSGFLALVAVIVSAAVGISATVASRTGFSLEHASLLPRKSGTST